jgi:UDP-sugar transporter A1/2/3
MVGVPAFLYTVQNNLLYVALSELDAPVFQVLYQLKVLTTAVFAVVLLRKHLSKRQWISLVMLAMGVSLMQLAEPKRANVDLGACYNVATHHTQTGVCLGAFESTSADTCAKIGGHWSPGMDATRCVSEGAPGYVWDPRMPVPDGASKNLSVRGLASVICAALTSGFAGIWFEKMLKESGKVSLWVRNIQLGGFGTSLALLNVWIKDGDAIAAAPGGFFEGYGTAVWITIFLAGAGGLLVAVVIKYADNIIKGFATSIAVMLSNIVCIYVPAFDYHPTLLLLIATSIVLSATYMYNYTPKGPKAKNARA